MSRMTPFTSPLLLGFDTMEKTLERLAKANDGYPPYNIERMAPDGAGEPERLRITLAVAGFRLIISMLASRKTSLSSAAARTRRASVTISIAVLRRASSSACSCSPMACRFPVRASPTACSVSISFVPSRNAWCEKLTFPSQSSVMAAMPDISRRRLKCSSNTQPPA